AVPAPDGSFTLEAGALARGKAGVFRVVVVQANGAASSFAGASTRFTYPYLVAADGSVDLSASQASLRMAPLFEAVNAGDRGKAESVLASLAEEKVDPVVLETARVIAATPDAKPGPAPAEAEGASLHLADATAKPAKVRRGRARANRLPAGTTLF